MNRKQKIFLSGVVIILLAITVAGAFFALTQNNSNKLKVVATFYPLYFFASEIGKEKAEVSMLIPDNAEVHSWQPQPNDMLKMENAKIFIYNGAGLEPWVEDFLGAIKNKPVIVDTSQNIPLQLSPHLQEALDRASTLLLENCTESMPSNLTFQSDNGTAYLLHLSQNTYSSANITLSQHKKLLFAFNQTLNFTVKNTTSILPILTFTQTDLAGYPPLVSAWVYTLEPGTYQIFLNTSAEYLGIVILPLAGEEEEEHEHGEHEHGIYDPHIWLDPLLAKIQVRNILAGFKAADPENATFYQLNAEALLARLDKLHSDFVSGLKNKTKSDIICSHLAFNYMGKRYGFKQHAALGITADREPTSPELGQLIEKLREYNLRYVFVEPGYPDRYMQTIAAETGAGVLVLDAVHGRTGEHANMDYFQIMYENLKNLRIGLEVID